VIQGYGVGAVDYLTKPFNPEIMRHKVAVFADLFRKTRALAELNDKLEERVKERTAELEKSEAALKVAARQKDEFLAVLAHELRNPLAPLRTGLDLLLQVQSQGEAVVGRTLAAMNRQLAHIVRLIDDLLDVSRINTGVLTLKKERVDLAALVHAAVETFRGIFDRKKVSVTVHAPLRVEAVVDATRISQIIGNLLHNASKYTREEGHVTVTLEFHAGLASIHVTDDGLGIPPEQLERVFEMFTKIERQLPGADHGSGIGLALARRLAAMHDGKLSVASPGEGKGTTFTLSVPAIQAVGASAAPITVPPPAPRQAGQRLDIVVVEDNDDAAEMLALWLEQLGHQVRVARTGGSGLEVVLTSVPDLVLCDVGLPEMDGVEVCRRIRAELPGPRPVMVALTGWGQEEDRKRTREAGFDHHLVKPVALDALSELLGRVQPALR
jgi:signal transduction histidine kinase/CheY-like chemotaxis protein